MSIRVAAQVTTLIMALLCAGWLTHQASAQDTPAPPQTASEPDVPSAVPEQPQPPVDENAPLRSRREVVHFGSNAYLGPGESAQLVLAVGGNATSEGRVSDAVVSIFGKTYATGEVGEAVVAVFGDVYVDGRVRRDVVAVGGNVTLGPNAVVEGDVHAVGGVVSADPASKIEGRIEQVTVPWGNASALQPWFKQGLMLGRPLAFDQGFGWAWNVAALFFVAYILIALLFPRPLNHAAITFEQRPGEIVLATFLTFLLLPLFSIALIATVVGIALLPFLWLGLLCGVLFGKAALLAAIGRRVTGLFGEGPLGHIAVAVAIGGLLIAAVYTVPMLGFITFAALWMLGLGLMSFMLVRGIRERQRRNDGGARRVDLSKRPPQAAPPAPEPSSAAPLPPQHSTDTAALLVLPRAGFWIRVAALFIDAVLVMFVVSVAADEDLILIALAGYGALMWKLKGTTIGGTLCNLQVVRADGREIDWPTAIVRALGCFLSLLGGLGFIWIAVDSERRAWHDKIAGTLVVRTEKTIALV